MVGVCNGPERPVQRKVIGSPSYCRFGGADASLE